MQLFLLGFIVIEICEIFTVGGFPLSDAVRKVGFIQDRLEVSADRKHLGIFCSTHRRDHGYFLGPSHERACRFPVA